MNIFRAPVLLGRAFDARTNDAVADFVHHYSDAIPGNPMLGIAVTALMAPYNNSMGLSAHLGLVFSDRSSISISSLLRGDSAVSNVITPDSALLKEVVLSIMAHADLADDRILRENILFTDGMVEDEPISYNYIISFAYDVMVPEAPEGMLPEEDIHQSNFLTTDCDAVRGRFMSFRVDAPTEGQILLHVTGTLNVFHEINQRFFEHHALIDDKPGSIRLNYQMPS